jgi:hypothetical protein
MAAAGAAVLVLVLLQNLFLLGASRLRTIIYVVAAQGVVLSTLPPLLHGGLGVQEVFAGAVVLMLKGVAIPRMLIRALADLPIRREVEPLVGFKTCLVLGAIATSGSVYLATILPLASLGGGPDDGVDLLDAIHGLGLSELCTRRGAVLQEELLPERPAAQHAAGPGTVVDHDLLTEGFTELIGDDACLRIGYTTSRPRHDPADGAGGIRVRGPRRAGNEQQSKHDAQRTDERFGSTDHPEFLLSPASLN